MQRSAKDASSILQLILPLSLDHTHTHTHTQSDTGHWPGLVSLVWKPQSLQGCPGCRQLWSSPPPSTQCQAIQPQGTESELCWTYSFTHSLNTHTHRTPSIHYQLRRAGATPTILSWLQTSRSHTGNGGNVATRSTLSHKTTLHLPLPLPSTMSRVVEPGLPWLLVGMAKTIDDVIRMQFGQKDEGKNNFLFTKFCTLTL